MPKSESRFARYSADLPDPRVDRTRWHRLDDIPVLTRCAVICGADPFEGIERFGDARADWLPTFPTSPHGIPSRDTSNRVLPASGRDRFSACFARWGTDPCEAPGLRAIAIDGKARRAAPGDTSGGCRHRVEARATGNNSFLGPVAVADRSNEIAARPGWRKVLDLQGASVARDAAFRQKAIVEPIRGPGGDDLVTVTGNQQTLHRAARAACERACDAELAGCAVVAPVGGGRRHGPMRARW